MCRQLTADSAAGMASEESRCEDKATSTDDELLASPQTRDAHSSGIAAVAQLWGADLVGLERPRLLKPHRRTLHHQESLSSASDVSRTRPHRLRKQRTTESCNADYRCKGRPRELRRQWTTDSSDSGYSKGYSRERLRRQDTEESAESSRKFVRELQRQPTTESSSSLRLTRQSSLRSGSDNQSLYLLRQSTIETYDEFSTTDFSRPQSSNSAANTASPSVPPTIHIEAPHCSREDDNLAAVQGDAISYIQTEDPIIEERIDEDFATVSVLPVTAGAPFLTSTSCSLINLSAIDLEASQINEIQRSLLCMSRLQKAKARRKKRREIAKKAAKVCRSRERVRPSTNKDELPKTVRWSIMATGLVLFLMSIILVGATLRMAPLIDEMVRKENEDILQKWQAGPSSDNVSTVPPSDAAMAQNGTWGVLPPVLPTAAGLMTISSSPVLSARKKRHSVFNSNKLILLLAGKTMSKYQYKSRGFRPRIGRDINSERSALNKNASSAKGTVVNIPFDKLNGIYSLPSSNNTGFSVSSLSSKQNSSVAVRKMLSNLSEISYNSSVSKTN
ncbi:uncharacterized protein LOC125177923 isoform X1 [Hyalella azteca]|uniref:Uncharacterized protein LOC125177923 isoform X1 n=1 Tax=Hyalella azteca TaxID=294128 RepID=A0A979FI00_HYAAZ|nr:uncharacterized protein LOC125177923 isoform X1 [Hyalella azteca]